MLQSFNRDTADLIMGMSAPIVIQLRQWKDLLEYLKSKKVVTVELRSTVTAVYNTNNQNTSIKDDYYSMLSYTVHNDFSIVFAEEAALQINRTHSFPRESIFPFTYADSIKAELAHFGYKDDQSIFPEVTADNLFD